MPARPSRNGTSAQSRRLRDAKPANPHLTAALQKQPPQNVKPQGAFAADEPFWRTKPLEAMTAAEWESLCDGCARCCLVKLEDEDTGTIHATDVGCTLLDSERCRCRDYAGRQERVPDCVKLTPQTVRELRWLPPTCAYRLVAEGRDLYWWHPLVSGDPDTVHTAGVSVRGRVSGSEDEFALGELLDRIVRWPDRVPKSCSRAGAGGTGGGPEISAASYDESPTSLLTGVPKRALQR